MDFQKTNEQTVPTLKVHIVWSVRHKYGVLHGY